MKKRKLGILETTEIGMGCMGFSHGYGKIPEEAESIRLMRFAHDLGCDFYDTAEVYGPYVNETLVGKAIKPFRKDIVLATKFSPFEIAGQKFPGGKLTRGGIRGALEASLDRLQTDMVDLYYMHRVPDDSPLEEIADWIGELIKAGLIRAWGLSECTETQLRRAHSVTPLSAIQSEYSMMERKYEKGVIPACSELGIGFVAYSPMAGGFLSGKYSASAKYEGDDVRRVITRYQPENVQANQPLLDELNQLAAKCHATPAQIALAWILKKEPFMVPIPGMRSEKRIRENLGAADVTLSDAEFRNLEEALSHIAIHGNRTDEDIAKLGTVQIELK